GHRAAEPRHRDWLRRFRSASVAKLAVPVVSPRPNRPIALHRHGEVTAGGDITNAAQPRHPDRCPRILAPGPELAIRVAAPGPYAAIRLQPHAMLSPNHHLDRDSVHLNHAACRQHEEQEELT